MTNVKTNFTEQTIYVGLDVHKRSWNAALYLNDQYLRNVHQPPSPRALLCLAVTRRYYFTVKLISSNYRKKKFMK